MGAHSKIGASSYSRWSKTHGGCPGSVKLSEGIQSAESPYAAEGTLAHDIAANMLYNYFVGGNHKVETKDLPPDMMPAVNLYVEFIKAEALAAKAQVKLNQILIEHKFDMSESVYPGLFGTADAIIYNEGLKKLIVADYKHGAGIEVDVEDNVQLMYYGLGALLSTGFPCDKVELVIVQPRCGGDAIRKWEFSSVELIEFAADLALDAKATEDESTLNPGKHCRFWPAAATKCPAIHAKAQALAKLQFKPELSYDPAKLDQALKFLPALEAWIKQVREFAYAESMHGRAPEGWKLVEKRGSRKWMRPEAEIVEYVTKAAHLPENDCYDRSLKSPAQMEKLMSKQLNEKLRTMIETVVSGYNLVPASDPRPAAKLDAKSEFTQITD